MLNPVFWCSLSVGLGLGLFTKSLCKTCLLTSMSPCHIFRWMARHVCLSNDSCPSAASIPKKVWLRQLFFAGVIAILFGTWQADGFAIRCRVKTSADFPKITCCRSCQTKTRWSHHEIKTWWCFPNVQDRQIGALSRNNFICWVIEVGPKSELNILQSEG